MHTGKNAQDCVRVMIVDDNDQVRRGLTVFLDSFDDLHFVGEATSGKQAIELCDELEPDVILMDLVMPEMDGATAIRIIHHKRPDIQIIALTSFGAEDLLQAALQAGARKYVLKNVGID